MKLELRHSTFLGPVLVLGASLAVWAQIGRVEQKVDVDLVIIPFTPTEVRVLSTVETAAFVYAPIEFDAQLRLESLSVTSGNDVIYSEALDVQLVGDPRFGEVNALIERLPHEIADSHSDRRYFADPAAPEFEGAEALDKRSEVLMRWNALSAEYDAGREQPFVQLNFPVHTDQVFFPEDPVGTEREIKIHVTFLQANGVRRTTTAVSPIVRLAAPLGLPQVLAGTGASVHPGDLHVHSCHGEASGACAPSSNCTAESLQLSGSFSYAQLRTQYEALGMDWFTATDHSYCINSASEYAVIQAECAAATDATFLCMPDIEVSSDEVGSQSGSDSGNLLCLGLTAANHMGAHGISARVPGGGDGLLGFCDGLFSDVLASFTSNIATIRGMGGYPIVNHPAGGNFGWNSIASTTGIEANGMHGVEIWNDAAQSGQGGHVASWVDWLRSGRLLYAYSGSDTHDAAFNFGANHVILGNEPFSSANLHAALRAGHNYISNEHALVIEAELGGSVIEMGSMYPLPPNTPAATYAPRVHYNFGADSSVITIFRGRVGDPAETVVCQSAPLTGQGTFTCSTTLEVNLNSWIRAYSESGSKTAYTNPVFFLPSSADPAAYCTAKVHTGGCGAQISSSGVASATSASTFNIDASNVLNQQSGLLFYGLAPDFAPFFDGTLCVGQPLVRTTVQNSGGNAGPPDCSGTYQFDFNAYVQSGADPNLTAGVEVYAQYWFRDTAAPSPAAVSNALYFSVGP